MGILKLSDITIHLQEELLESCVVHRPFRHCNRFFFVLHKVKCEEMKLLAAVWAIQLSDGIFLDSGVGLGTLEDH